MYSARARGGVRAVGLLRRAQGDRAELQQLPAAQAKELLRLLVRIHEAAAVDLEHHDGLGGVIDQQLVALRAVEHRLLGGAPLAHVTQAQHEHLPARQRRLADGDLGRKLPPVLVLRPQLARGQIERGVPEARRQALERLGHGLVGGDGDLRQQQVDALALDLLLGVAKDAHPGGVEGVDEAGLIDQQHHVLDVIEDHLQVLARLLARLERERLRLIRHQAHGLDDAAPFALDRPVVLVDQAQEHRHVGVGVAGAQLQLAQLRLQRRVQLGILFRMRPGVRPNERGGGPGSAFRDLGAGAGGMRF